MTPAADPSTPVATPAFARCPEATPAEAPAGSPPGPPPAIGTVGSPPPPLTAGTDLAAQLTGPGWAVLDASTLARLAGLGADTAAMWAPFWQALPPDAHLRDGGAYRRRRHGCFVVDAGSHPAVRAVPHRAHWQPLAYNALHGGYERWFEPLPAALVERADWAGLLLALAGVASTLRGPQPWHVEAHAFRIDTTGGIGRPTPEGAHRDGVDLVAVVLLGRHGVKGGETRVFDARGPQGVRFMLREPFSVLLLDDARVIHETTPIQPREPGAEGWRDTLVLTYRRGGFQGPHSEPERRIAAAV
jgi:hypothetical protein